MKPVTTTSGYRLVPPAGAVCYTWRNPGGIWIRDHAPRGHAWWTPELVRHWTILDGDEHA